MNYDSQAWKDRPAIQTTWGTKAGRLQIQDQSRQHNESMSQNQNTNKGLSMWLGAECLSSVQEAVGHQIPCTYTRS